MAQDSAYTSVKILPKAFKLFSFHGRNLDFGGGKWDKATVYLKNNHNCENLVFDPYNRTDEHNKEVATIVETTGVDSVTCLNVLNVIKDKDERHKLYYTLGLVVHSSYMAGKLPIMIFQVYEGDKTANKDIQTCMKAKEYVPEIQAHFPSWSIKRKGNVIIVFKAEHCRTWEHISHPYVAI